MTLLSGAEAYAATAPILERHHYLGPTKTMRFAWVDEFGVMVFGSPRSRNLPPDWLELVRWCLTGGRDAGSQQWAAFRRCVREQSRASTIISYSDPSQGHSGALYRACGWLWAPTWHRLRPPPTGNGAWIAGQQQAVKDRWVFPLSPDDQREKKLAVNDATLMKTMPWASYRDPKFKGGGLVWGRGRL